MIPHLIEGDRRSTQKQNVDTVQVQEVEEEIAIQKIIEDPEAAAQETETKDVIIVVQAGLILQNVPRKKLDPLQKKSHEVLRVAHSQIK